MAIKLFNTLTKKVEEFSPITPREVRMYHCGPTVYDRAHIGNLRAFVLADLLRRLFEYEGYKVDQVINITDIGHLSGDADEGEDKMTKGLLREGKELSLEAMKELADRYAELFLEDIEKLNILKPHHLPKASDHVEEDISLIKILEDKGYVYKTADGLYFDTAKDKKYGQLGGLTPESDTSSRIGENAEKKNLKDFALWKFNDKLGFPSPWGQGFPGWHIECSAMSIKYFGPHFDIHTGGVDLAPIHHNNEIAQSESATGEKFVNFWIHNEFVNVSGEKMAKSEGNHLTLELLEKKGFSPLAYRYFLLSSHYRTKTNFTWEALGAAENAYRKLKEFMAQVSRLNLSTPSVDSEYVMKFKNVIENDLNTPEALAVVWQLIKDDSINPESKYATLLDFDKVLGLKLDENEYEAKEIPEAVNMLLIERDAARIAQNWDKADQIREKIRTLGYEVKDTSDGQTLEKI